MTAKHGSDLKRCSCRMCRRGLRTAHGEAVMRYARRKLRRLAKFACRLAAVDPYSEVPDRVSIPYTD